MSGVEILIFVLLIVGEVSCIYLVNNTKQLAKNNADILQNRDKEYEAEKGRNLATKEDIEEITKKVEEVKAEVSLAHQQKYDLLLEQKQLLIAVLNDATKITQAQNKLALYLFDTSSRNKFDELVETVSDTLTHFFHSCNLTRVAVPIEDIDKRIEDLSVIVTLYGSHISVTATNAASIVEQFNNEFDYALHQAKTDEDKAAWMQRSVMTKQKIENMRNKANPYRDEMQAAVEKYCGWLKQLYGMEFFTFKVQ